ncbi:uncharacterized protein LOC109534697 isoform X2 [Dendroctonus ponderosae]|uniref:uncharacterized protein LOC109534697 isoform X2 n=1 Tax=Dendroctonus ponderosae TaxID=77166 RepID=UPI0020360DDE|nr:uncharacterized protein LOC109534697 isoform X2 [Dendroctonus ponderosae]
MFCSNYRLLGAYQHHLGHVCMFSVSPVIQWTLMSSEHAMKAKTPSTIRETWAQFCRNTYAPAFGFIFDGSPIGKIFWITYILVGMGCVVYVTMDILAGWNGDAFYMTLDASSLEITDLEFPAIAVCDINRISKQRAIQLAENLTEVSSLPFSELLDLTQLIGNMYDRNINQMNKFERLQTILNVYDNGTTEETIIRRLADLMTPCEELLQTCIWNSEPYDCADLFETRLTDTGLCCTFNYPLETAERKIISDRGAKLVDTPRQFMGIGVASGLSLIVNNNLTDYFYTSMATRGVLLKIFSPNNVPDTASGAVKQVVVQEQADVFVDVEVNLLLTEDSLKSNQQKERRCLFADSVSTEFGNYTMSNCLVLCRVQGILDYCRCAPVLVPTNSKSYLSSVSVCNLLDIPCLQEHEARFHTYHFYKNQEMQFQKLIQNEEALLCPACVDNCIEATYGIDTNYFEFFNPDSRYPLLWVLCFLGGIAGTVVTTLTILEASRSESVYVNIEAPVPITEIQFPGIAICEFNKISKHRAVELANKLSTVSNLGRVKLLNMTRLLGNLYDYSNVGAEDLETLQDLLDQLDGGTSEEDMIRRLASLVTPCEYLLHNCTWNSISYTCTDLFQMRFTDSGLCCVFNYVRDTPEAALLSRGNKATASGSIKMFMGAGPARGLSVSIANNLSDYFYTSMATRGALLKLFLPTDFADLPSGSLKNIIVPERSDVYVDIVGKKLNTSSTFRALPIKQRKCKFTDEDPTAFGAYTMSNCLVQCRLRCIVTLCHCIPVMLPVSAQSYKDGVTFCNLKNLACLSQFSGKWLRYYPLEDPLAVELSFEFEDSLVCKNCLPNCADTLYDTSTSYLEFHTGSDYLNSSRVHVFSGNGQAKYYKKRVATMWFESLSTVGGILSFIMGISIINLVEIAVVWAKLVATFLWQ